MRRSKKLLAATVALTTMVTAVAPTMAEATDTTVVGTGPEKTYLVTFEKSVVPTVADATDAKQQAVIERAADKLEVRSDVSEAEPVAARVALVTSTLTARQLDSLPGVALVEEDHTLELFAADPSENVQWFLDNAGGSLYGYPLTADADIDANAAWATSTGNGVVVAIVDSGVQLNHPDLASRIWTNPGETSCVDGVDNDANGFVDDCQGWDFGNGDKDPSPTVSDHGTHVAGTVGSPRNGVGGVGVAPDARLMALKIDNNAGTINISAAAAAIYYAADNGAKVINASWGSSTPTSTLQNALAYAATKNVIVIAAAGNNAQTLTNASTFYPAGYWTSNTNVVSVASSAMDDALSGFSNRGLVTLSAPGSLIYATITGSGYDFKQGTSMASPVVAGIAALVLANENLTPSQMRQRLIDTVDHPATLGAAGGAGRVNAAAAVAAGGGGGGGGGGATTTTSTSTTSTTAASALRPPAPGRLTALGIADRAEVTFAAVRFRPSPVLNYTVTLGNETKTVPAAGPFRADFTGLTPGQTYSVSVVANVAAGSGAASTTSVTTGTGSAAPAVTATTPGFGSMKVTWAPLRAYAGKVPISMIKVEGGGKTVELRGSARTATLTGLTGGTSMSVTITAYHGATAGQSTTVTNLVPYELVAPGDPASIAATPKRNGVVVSWTPPATGLATSYLVTVGGVTKTVNAKSRTTTMRASAGSVQVSVVAVNPYGSSDPVLQTVSVWS